MHNLPKIFKKSFFFKNWKILQKISIFQEKIFDEKMVIFGKKWKISDIFGELFLWKITFMTPTQTLENWQPLCPPMKKTLITSDAGPSLNSYQGRRQVVPAPRDWGGGDEKSIIFPTTGVTTTDDRRILMKAYPQWRSWRAFFQKTRYRGKLFQKGLKLGGDVNFINLQKFGGMGDTDPRCLPLYWHVLGHISPTHTPMMYKYTF